MKGAGGALLKRLDVIGVCPAKMRPVRAKIVLNGQFGRRQLGSYLQPFIGDLFYMGFMPPLQILIWPLNHR